MTPTTTARESLFATPRAQQEAHAAAELIAEAGSQVTLDGVELGGEIRDLLRQIIAIVAEGGTVTVGAMPEIITTTVAAELLGISRTTLMKHVRAGDLPSTRTGSHTKLRRDDVLAFRRERLRKQRDALNELLAIEDRLGIE